MSSPTRDGVPLRFNCSTPHCAGQNGWGRNFAEIFGEIERPELLLLALLLHDVGKGMPQREHVAGSLQAAEVVCDRLGMPPEDRETIRFLITNHLETAASIQRRDIFDPETIRNFAAKVGSTERLKMLCLVTYGDIKAVSPEALTPLEGGAVVAALRRDVGLARAERG